ncbi:MAG: phosphoribosylformylglycinamidine synthase subunit PurS [Candidatus Bathyarchaeia archaeon]
MPRYRAKISISPKRGLFDPEGEELLNRLKRKGCSDVLAVRSGKYWELIIEADSKEDAIKRVTQIYSNPPVTNPVKDEPTLIDLEEIK